MQIYRGESAKLVIVSSDGAKAFVGDDIEPLLDDALAYDREAGHKPTKAGPRYGPWAVALLGLTAAPLLWLLVLHYSIGTLVAELRTSTPASQETPEYVEDLYSEVHRLRAKMKADKDRSGAKGGRKRKKSKRDGEGRRKRKKGEDDQEDDPENDEGRGGRKNGGKKGRKKQPDLREDAERPDEGGP